MEANANSLKYLEQLVNLTFASEDGFSVRNLGENAPDRPHLLLHSLTTIHYSNYLRQRRIRNYVDQAEFQVPDTTM